MEHHGRFNAYEESWTDKAIRRLIRDAGPYLHDLLTFSSGDLTTKNPKKARRAKREDASLRRRINSLMEAEPKFPRGLGEQIIKAFDLERGPEVRLAMDWLREEVRSNRISADLDPEMYIEALRNAQTLWQPKETKSSPN